MLRYWVWLTQCDTIGPTTALHLMERFGTPEAVYFADAQALSLANLGQKEIAALGNKDLREADAIVDRCYQLNIRILTLQDAAYPGLLRTIDDPPAVLYCRGRLPDLSARPVIGVVGARDASVYGLTSAKRLGYQLGRCGAIVVTGLAKGVDTQAAEGALSSGTPVIGVLGCGPDVVYPPQNRYLYLDVLRNGCLISEYPPGTQPLGFHFPIRNRIISGLSDGVIVVEAGEKSGSLITAEHALEQGRDVFAVPGNIDNPACAGSNQLLRGGAILITCGYDAVREYEHRYPETITPFYGGNTIEVRPEQKAASPVFDPGPEQKTTEEKRPIDIQRLKERVTTEEFTVLETLKDGELQLDAVIAASALPASKVLTALTLLEVKGFITRAPGKRYSLAQQGS